MSFRSGGTSPSSPSTWPALPSQTIESELFGHEMGAFASASRARVGKFEHARGGTLFLDEIGAMPLSLQAKLLRVIEARTIERLGSNESIDLDVRFVASTKEDLDTMVADGSFRDDLYYRLNVVSLTLPPLRARLGDAPTAVSASGERGGAALSPGGTDGHARSPGPGLRPRTGPATCASCATPPTVSCSASAWRTPHRKPRVPAWPNSVEAEERRLIATSLAKNQGNLKATYEALGLSRKTLYEKMQKHGLKREDSWRGIGLLPREAGNVTDPSMFPNPPIELPGMGENYKKTPGLKY